MIVGELIQKLQQFSPLLDVRVDLEGGDSAEPKPEQIWSNEDDDLFFTEAERSEAAEAGESLREIILL